MSIRRTIYFVLIVLMLTVASSLQPSVVRAQDVSSTDAAIIPADSILVDSITADSISVDSLTVRKKKAEGGGLTAVVNYKASDSLVFSMGNMAWLYGSSQVTYDDIDLTAERIRMSLDSSLVHANGIPDTAAQEGSHKLIGAPVFKDKSGEYETKTISYNFKTQKGFITDVVTQQGDGYVTGGTTKKMPDGDIFFENGRYTTCDYHECPHFYINLTKARVRPKKNIVTGPAYLVVADVPLPLAIPFGYFPFSKTYSSGVIMPTYGADMSRGLYLRDGGYYFAINDYMDLSLKGQVFTKGTWGLSASTKYAWRYKFKGNMSFNYLKTVTGDKGMPDYSESTDIRAVWSHTQDSRFNPNLSLSASVNFSTGFERRNLSSFYSSDMTNNTKSSTINATYKIPNTQWNISATASVNQIMRDSTLQVQFPELVVSMGRVYPFKRKVRAGAEKWYEKIAMSYNARLTNSIRTKQDQFKNKSLIRDWTNGIQHSVPVSATFTVAKYINVTPSFNLTDRMYTHKIDQFYDPSMINSDGSYGGIARDTTYGFYNVYNYSTSISASTKLYGFYKPAPFFKNAKLVAVRHLFTPSLSFSYTPDFGQKKYGSWSSYQMPDAKSPTGIRTVDYSPFSGMPFGTTGRGKVGSISFNMNNNIEAKFRSDKDSTGYKKVSIIDNLTTGINYNLAADSMRWSQTIPVSLVVKMGKTGSMNLSATFDTYKYGLNSAGNPVHIDKPRWEVGELPRLMNTGYSYSYQLSNTKVAKWFGFGDDTDDDELDINDGDYQDGDDLVDEDLDPSYDKEKQAERRKKNKGKGTSTYDADGYLIWSVPWTMNISYTMRYAYNNRKFDKKKMEYRMGITHSASVNGNINPTKNWNFNYSLTYDFNEHQVTYMNMSCSRDMHCWTLTAAMTPLGRYASFHVCIAVKSSMLSDLKYEKSTVSRSNKIEWYDD